MSDQKPSDSFPYQVHKRSAGFPNGPAFIEINDWQKAQNIRYILQQIEVMDNYEQKRKSLHSLNSDDFEALVASIWSALGWSTDITQSSRDQGVDIIASKSGIHDEKALIQAKCYNSSNKVGRPEIQQYSTLKREVVDADAVIVVTSSDFTSEAIKLANQLNVKTVSGEDLIQAALENLPDERLEDLLSDSSMETNSAASPPKHTSTNNINYGDLSESEMDLAKILKGYYQRFLNDTRRSNKVDRVLVFDINGIEETVQKTYQIYDQYHMIELYPEKYALLERFEKTAAKYGWDVLNREKEVTRRVGFDLTQVTKGDSNFSMIIDTEKGRETVNPERQAKISSLISEHIFHKDIAGMLVIEASADDWSREGATVIGGSANNEPFWES